jgi:RimJ/RimL family protein N-acetyltransferase
MSNLENRVVLRDVIEADLPIFYEQQLDPDATAMAAFPSRDRERFMAHWAKILRDEIGIKQTILYDGQVAGNIVSYEMEGETEVGYWIGKSFWGKGIATQALTHFLEVVKIRPLYAHVAQHNIASTRVLQKCGFVIIGEDNGLSNVPGEEVEEYILKLEAISSS